MNFLSCIGRRNLVVEFVLGLVVTIAVMKTPASAASVPGPVKTAGLASSGHPQYAAHRYTLADGASLAYYIRPGRPTLVLVPGTGKDRSVFLDSGFVDRLSPSLGVVIVEMRGRGQSWPPPNPAQANVEQYASDVLELVHALQFESWYMSGHSLGGMITLEIAGRNPSGLRGAIPLEGWVHYSVAAEAFREDNLPPGQRYSLSKPKDVPPGWTEEQEIALLRMWRTWEGGERAVQQAQCPVLAFVGDRNLSPRPSRRVLKFPDRPNIELYWVKGAGHKILESKFAGEVAEAVNGFIAEVESRSRDPK